jgi:hypothetical protein
MRWMYIPVQQCQGRKKIKSLIPLKLKQLLQNRILDSRSFGSSGVMNFLSSTFHIRSFFFMFPEYEVEINVLECSILLVCRVQYKYLVPCITPSNSRLLRTVNTLHNTYIYMPFTGSVGTGKVFAGKGKSAAGRDPVVPRFVIVSFFVSF